MRIFWFVAALVVVAVVAEIALPGQNVYRSGCYNVALAALIVIELARVRALVRARPEPDARDRSALVVTVAIGVAVIGVAGIACGLLAPDPQQVVGAPGSSVRVDALGRTLYFPALHEAPAIPFAAGYLVRAIPRSVVEVQAFDAQGGHLTITQPSGSAFLSPVLLMQTHQSIAGLNLPYDSFAVPAAHRIVKAVLFTAQEAAALRGARGSPAPAVLFDVENQGERSLPHGLALARDGQTVSVAGLGLRANVATYPALDVIAIPNLFVVAAGVLALAIGLAIALAKTPLRS